MSVLRPKDGDHIGRGRLVPADGESLDAHGAKDAAESFDEYSARMKVEFSAAQVYSATRGRPAASTYTRKSPDLQEKPAGRIVSYKADGS
jgi:hypothetical protein